MYVILVEINTTTTDSGIKFGGPTSTMLMEAELEQKIANLCRSIKFKFSKKKNIMEMIVHLSTTLYVQSIIFTVTRLDLYKGVFHRHIPFYELARLQNVLSNTLQN